MARPLLLRSGMNPYFKYQRLAVASIFVALAAACAACGPAVVEDLSTNPNAVTGLEIDVPTGATQSEFDVFDSTGKKVLGYQHAGAPITVVAGTYSIRRYMDSRYVWAKDVVVATKAVTHVSLGAVRVLSVAGTVDGRFATLDTNHSPLADLDEPGVPIAAPAGDLLVADHMSTKLVYAAVHVTPLAISDVTLGAIRLHVPAGTDDGQFSVWDEAKTKILRDREEREAIVAVGAGNYTLTRELEGRFEYARVAVAAGTITEVSLGALRWNRAVNANLSKGTDFMAQIIPAFTYAIPAGTYALADTLSAQPLASPSVETGAITVAQ